MLVAFDQRFVMPARLLKSQGETTGPSEKLN
jgi:hypothetical protein